MAVTFTETVDDIVATTFRNVRPTVVDNFYKSRPLISAILNKGNIKVLLDGGERIQQDIQYDKPSSGSYGIGDELDISRRQLFTGLIFPWAQYYSSITIEGLEELQNAGASKIIDLTALRMNAAREAIENDLGQHVFLDGTGNQSKDLVGLRAAVDDGTTVASYGGITRATTGPGNFIKAGGIDTTGGSLTLDVLTTSMGNATIGTKRPDLIITTQTLWNKIHDRLQPQQRAPTTPAGEQLANFGFTVLTYIGASIVADNQCPSGQVWFLNTDYLNLYVHEKRFFEPIGPITPSNRDQKVYRLHLATQLVCSSPRMQALATGLS